MENFIKKAAVLIEAIPYIHAFRRKVFVIKYGGSILDDPVIRKNIFQDIIFLSYVGIRTVIVHGGGHASPVRVTAKGCCLDENGIGDRQSRLLRLRVRFAS